MTTTVNRPTGVLPVRPQLLDVLPLGAVYGTLLNTRAEFEASRAAMQDAPYLGAPRAPVLYLKPGNTFNASGEVQLPPGESHLAVGATLAMVFMPNWAHVQSPAADIDLASTVWCQLMIDWHLPHSVHGAGYFRPPLKFNGHDGFLGLARKRLGLAAPQDVGLSLELNGVRVLDLDLRSLVRSPSALLADVCTFMTPLPLDALLLGNATLPDGSAVLAQAGDTVRWFSPTHRELGEVTQTVVAHKAPTP